MVDYKKKKIRLQSGGVRNFYYKVISNGKKKQISKMEYLNKKGGEGEGETQTGRNNQLLPNPMENNNVKSPYILITAGPTGSGKSSLINKSLRYLSLEEPPEDNKFIIDTLVEANLSYKEQSSQILKEYFGNINKTRSVNNIKNTIKQKINEIVIIPKESTTNNSIFNKFTKAYWTTRPIISEKFDNSIKSAISKNENFILETTGYNFPSIIGWTNPKYNIFISYSLVEFCTLINRNIERMVEQIKNFLTSNHNAPRLPDMRIDVFSKIIDMIMDKLIKIIEKCNRENCKTNQNFHTPEKRHFCLLIFDNTRSNKKNDDSPIFDSNKNKNFDEIKEHIRTNYYPKLNCRSA
jgi:hypothetical protein